MMMAMVIRDRLVDTIVSLSVLCCALRRAHTDSAKFARRLGHFYGAAFVVRVAIAPSGSPGRPLTRSCTIVGVALRLGPIGLPQELFSLADDEQPTPHPKEGDLPTIRRRRLSGPLSVLLPHCGGGAARCWMLGGSWRKCKNTHARKNSANNCKNNRRN
jgi:hypothetical protein